MGLMRDAVWNLRLKDARAAILAALAEKTYSQRDLETLLAAHRDEWRFPTTLSAEYFVEHLLKIKILRRHQFVRRSDTAAASYPNEVVLYATADAHDVDLAMGLRGNSYLSHLSAAYVHGLTNLVPRVYYTNREQAPKAARAQAVLTQDAVARAFSKAERATGFEYTDQRIAVVLLAGKSTNRLEVFNTPFPGEMGQYATTSLERTLIDCTVRPAHAGGVDELPGMYAAAKARVSVRRLSKVLDELNFIYPYRQAVGFLMDRAGYSESQLSLFERQPFTLDFYLDFAMQDTDYSSRWRLYYPKGL